MNCYKNWRNIEYLNQGTDTQKRAFASLMQSSVLSMLTDFDPIVVGTIPIDIHISNSDIDIICHTKNPGESLFADLFHKFQGYKSWTRMFSDGPATICVFKSSGFQYEIFCQDVPTERQMAFRHMIQECRLLHLLGINFKNKIIALKEGGLKTEPAFAQVLGLRGNAYQELLKFEDISDNEIIRIYGKNLS